jgi:hypothetical protein
MTKRDDKHSMAEDLLDQIKLIIERATPSLLQLAMDNGQVLAYWKDLPYRGQSEKNPPKVKTRVRSPQEIRRTYYSIGLSLFMVVACTALTLYFSSPDVRDSLLFLIGMGGVLLLVMAGLAKGINVWNKYLRADDLDEPEDELNEEVE